MSAYYIATPIEIMDPEGMKKYATGSHHVLESFGGRYLMQRAPAQCLAGDWNPKYLTILEFPTKQRLLEWYDSDSYRPWRELRERSAKASIVVTEA
jgi:uncharacterized protein (DUF1330 family)